MISRDRIDLIERLVAQDVCMFSGDIRCAHCIKREACRKFRTSIDKALEERDAPRTRKKA